MPSGKTRVPFLRQRGDDAPRKTDECARPPPILSSPALRSCIARGTFDGSSPNCDATVLRPGTFRRRPWAGSRQAVWTRCSPAYRSPMALHEKSSGSCIVLAAGWIDRTAASLSNDIGRMSGRADPSARRSGRPYRPNPSRKGSRSPPVVAKIAVAALFRPHFPASLPTWVLALLRCQGGNGLTNRKLWPRKSGDGGSRTPS